jgi:DNA-binding transcriptional MerR regulator
MWLTASSMDPGNDVTFSLAELAAKASVPARTIRYYQSEGLLPRPDRRGREAIYRPEHLERIGLIMELRDRGLTLSAIKNLVTAEHPARTVSEWLGVDTTLSVPWSDDRPRLLSRDELRELIGPKRRGLLGELEDAGFIRAEGTSGVWIVPSPTLFGLALQLQDAGIDVEISGKLRDLLSERLANAVDEAVKLIVYRVGTGFAGQASPDELATALGALRPTAREMTGVILAQEVERALRDLVNSGPTALLKASRRMAREKRREEAAAQAAAQAAERQPPT